MTRTPVWPEDRLKTEPLYLTSKEKPMRACAGGKQASMLARTRGILLRMQPHDPDLVDLQIGRISRYCWKISGTTAMLAQKKEKAMITGQGRWGLYVKRPSAMIEYYRQASLAEKLATTDLVVAATRIKVEYEP